MPKHTNYLIGGGERLTESIPAPRKRVKKSHPYSFDVAKKFVSERLRETSAELDTLPDLACPGDKTIACLTLHPAYLAKSYYPADLFSLIGLEAVGSKQTMIKPRLSLSRRPKAAEASATTTFFVAGHRDAFREFSETIASLRPDSKEAADIRKIETVTVPDDKIRLIRSDVKSSLLEVVLHSSATAEMVIEGFRDYLRSLGVNVDLDKRLQAGGLCFLPVEAPSELVGQIADYSFLRAVREMPRLRMFRPMMRSGGTAFGFNVTLPTNDATSTELKVAIFDGGLPAQPDLSQWVNYYQPAGLKNGVPKLEEHGLAVTSALLFGSIDERLPLPTPHTKIDHYRVLDEDALVDKSLEYHDVIRRIRDILQQNKYDFVNLSLGPPAPISNDEDVHAWTSILDELLADGSTLSTVAVGNDGAKDWDSGMARIQPPSDCVNVLSIGSADKQGHIWGRADYSCIGPGRGPGYVKPDALSFGGSKDEPFYVLQPNVNPLTQPIDGTSFACPNALRTAVGVRTHLGDALTPLAVKALVLHKCEYLAHEPREVGHGRILEDISDLITCEDDTVHVIYKDTLSAGGWIRAKIPVPDKDLEGSIEISATLCYTTEIDPHHTMNYTRSGVQIVFRPNIDNVRPLSVRDFAAGRARVPVSETFFRNRLGSLAKTALRRDALTWETTRTDRRVFRDAGRIKEPTFDLYYNAREDGHPTDNKSVVPYALVITVRKREDNTLYNSIVRRYRSELEILRPVLHIPIRF